MARPWQPRELSSPFTVLRDAWLSERPFPHFLAGEADAPTYGVELDLDHARSYIASMFDQFTAGSPHFRFADRIREEEEELVQLAAHLATTPSHEPIVAALQQYISDTRQLLDAFAAEHAAWASSSRVR